MLTARHDSVAAALAARRSVRAFTDAPVDADRLRAILQMAQRSPSGGNLQPWRVVVMTGAPWAALRADALAALALGPAAGDAGIAFDHAIYPEPLGEPYARRRRDVGAGLYQALGIARGDRAARDAQSRANFTGFGAPVMLFCALPAAHGPAQWADAGLWLQSVMLLLTAEGLGCCAQESWAMIGPTVRRACGLGDDWRIWTGLAIGHADPDHPANLWPVPRAPLTDVVDWIGFDPPLDADRGIKAG